MKTVTIEGVLRTDLGKKASADLRRSELVPCVIYGGESNIHLHVPVSSLRHLIFTPDFKKAVINVDGKSYEVLVKDVQQHPVNEKILHVDFLQLVPGKKIKVQVPIRLVGMAKGVRAGGKLLQNVRRILVQTTPESLVEAIELNVESLDLGKSIRARDVITNEGTTILTAPALPLATVEIPRALRSNQGKDGK